MTHKRILNGTKVPEDNKVSKLEKNEVKKKPLTKLELQNNYDILVKEHEELVKLHQENLIRIDKLENTIIKIRKEEEESIEKAHVEAQTDDSVTCNECEFPANDIWELGEHIYEFHTLKDHGDFACTFCYETRLCCFNVKTNCVILKKFRSKKFLSKKIFGKKKFSEKNKKTKFLVKKNSG